MKRTLVFGLLSGAAWAQQSPVIRTEANVVLVDAIVTAKNGTYIRDLTAKDFRIWQDDKEQTIKSLTLESATAASEPRSLVLFFDATGMEVRDQVLVRQAASRFIDAETGPNRRMAVVIYNGSLRMAQTFTDNAGLLKAALPAPEANLGEQEKTSPGKKTATPVNSAGSELGTRNMLQAIRKLGSSLGVLPGRKIVVLFTGKVPSTSAQRSDARETIEACNRSGVALYPVDVRAALDQLESEPRPDLLPADRARLSSMHGVMAQPQGDVAGDVGLSADSGSGGQQILYSLAGGTGGLMIRNSNDLLAELQRVAGEQDEYYAITYTPPDAKEGSCHKLRVKVDRGGTTLRARNGYCTTKPVDALAGAPAGADLEKRAAGAGMIAASVELPYVYAAPNVARVHVAMEISPGALKFENQKGKLHAELALQGTASTSEGEVRARFSDVLKLDFDSQPKGPIHYEKEFRIAPGQYTFAILFGQTGAGFGKLEKPLSIEPWAGTELALSSLVLSKQTRPAADAGLGLVVEDRTPLVAEGTEIVPSGSYRFLNSDPAVFFFEAYGPDVSSVRIRARILNRQSGEEKWNSGLLKLPGAGGDDKPAKLPAGSPLPINALSAGSYQLELTAAVTGVGQVKRTADFEIQ